jgi:tetratricopeptide (TPR) repeat protein
MSPVRAHLIVVFLAFSMPAFAEGLEDAREHLQKGRYEEAAADYVAILETETDSVPAAVGLSRSLEAQGQYTEAIAKLAAADQEDPNILARLAELQFAIGRLEEAAVSCQAALEHDADHARARMVQTRLQVELGQLEEADIGFRWFVRYYNRKQPTDAETLMLVAEGSAEYARWHSVSQIFGFVINTLCTDALKDDELSWQTHLVSGALLLEKYNRAQAIPDLKKALAINPRAVEAIVALGAAALQKHDLDQAALFAKQAVAVQENSVIALQLKADVELTKGEISAALESLQKAEQVNAVDQGTLGRIAACYYLIDAKADADADDERLKQLLANLDAIDDDVPEQPTRLEELVIGVARRNPKPGVFLAAFGRGLETKRKFDMVEKLYQHAIRLMPQLSQPKTALGMLYMQMGRSEQAKEILDDAFKADPYHVRVSNMRKVLGVLGGYETISTDHFVIRVDSQADRILGEYMAEYLEEVYAELVELYQFEPPNRTTFEIYHNAKGLSAHQWFSARMIGLPWIQTIGASTGMMVALSSPTAVEKPYNWARVIKHEFVHVVTLQQTRFNIPHWFTEALAVTSENIERPAVWNRLLLERVPRGELWSLDELTQIFVRPPTPLDWQFAYCQSRLYAQYMIETYGEETIAALLDSYRRNVPTNTGIEQVFKVSVKEFEAGYHAFLKRIVEEELGGSAVEAPKSLADLEKYFNANPDDPSAMAGFAAAMLKVNRRRQARELAEAALEKNAREPLAAVVLAQLEMLAQDIDEAEEFLQTALDAEKPDRRVLGMLARVRLLQGEAADAARLYELGRDKLGIGKAYLPGTDEWLKGQAAAYVKLGETDKLQSVLESIARLDGDNAVVRKKLAQMAVERDDLEAAGKWAGQALYIDVMDADIHSVLAKVYESRGDKDRADRERRFAEQLKNDE